jgi:phenylacetate-CoA ligase
MSKLADKISQYILKLAPIFVQNVAITVFNSHKWSKRRRYGYWKFRRQFEDIVQADVGAVQTEANARLRRFLMHAINQSDWYSSQPSTTNLETFPVLTKEDLVDNLDSIATLTEDKAAVSYTGGTTGASLKVLYTKQNMAERAALLDWFRGQYGWEIGRRTAWFSGKSIVSDTDLQKGICYRDDWVSKIRFFSTFHINRQSFDIYWKALESFKPEFIVGFPSSVIEIAEIASERGLALSAPVSVFFPTAETVLPSHRELVERVFGGYTRDQYASSEGAPFILECPKGKLHIHPLSGVFEVVDEQLLPARQGEVLVTAFHTEGTPLIRYRIGDKIALAKEGETCDCGWPFPIVKSLEGRTTDFLWSPERGRINLGNLTNCTKGVVGIQKFQVIQSEPHSVLIKIQINSGFDETQRALFESALRVRTGDKMQMEFQIVPDISREASGKFRIIKSNMKSEQMEFEG